MVVWPLSVTAYPVTWPGSFSLNRSRTSTPDRRNRAKNSASPPACCAASTIRARSTARTICGGSSGPRQSAAGAAQRARNFGKLRSAASFPPPYQITPLSRPVCRGRPTAYPGDLTGARRAVPLAHQQARPAQPGEELLLRARPACRSADHPAESGPGHLGPTAPRGLFGLGAGRPLGGGAGPLGRWTAARTTALPPGRRPGPGRSRSTPSAGSRPDGQASPPGECDPQRAGPPPTAPPTHPLPAQVRSES